MPSPSPARSARTRTISLELGGHGEGYLATGVASGSVAGEGWLTGLAGAVAVGVAGPQSVSLSSSLSESWPPPVAPCPMVGTAVAPLRVASLVGSVRLDGVVLPLGSV